MLAKKNGKNLGKVDQLWREVVQIFSDTIRRRITIASFQGMCGRQRRCKMAIQSVFILNKAGGLIYHNDRSNSKNDVEKTFSFPLDIVLKEDDKLTVVFGERDGIKGILYTYPSLFKLNSFSNIFGFPQSPRILDCMLL